MRNPILKKLYTKETLDTLKCLYPYGDPKKQAEAFSRRKIKVFLLAALATVLLAVLSAISGKASGELVDGRLLRRADYGGETKSIELFAVNGLTGEEENIEVRVREKRYSNQTLEEMTAALEKEVPERLLGENLSAEQVSGDMVFPSAFPEYPFTVSYKTDHPLILSSDGVLHEDKLKQQLSKQSGNGADTQGGALEGIPVKVIMTLLYEDFRGEISFYVRVILSEKTREKSFREAVNEAVLLASEETREEDYLRLPESLYEIPVSYRERSAGTPFIILAVGLTAAILLCKREDDNLKEQLKKREKQLLEDYPMIVNKFALFYSVGMTTKGIFQKLCRDYEETKKRKNGKGFRYVYEELLLTRAKMEEGVGEIAAYEDLARRLKHPKYRQLINLMEQAVSKGKSDISLTLSKELQKAFAERKNHAKELGEEAGTKLLLPMFLMLLVVIIVIMIPAFLAFQI